MVACPGCTPFLFGAMKPFPDRTAGGHATLGRPDCQPDAHPTGDGHPTIASHRCIEGELLPPINDDGFLWLNNKVDPSGLLVKDGSNRTSLWINQFTGPSAAVDSPSQDAHGVALPVGQWPVWTPGAQGTLPGMLWSRAAFTNQNAIYPNGTLNKPSADSAPVTILAVVRPFDLQGGHVLTLRLNNLDCEFMLEHYGPNPLFQQGSSAAQDAQGTLFQQGLIDYSNQTVLVDWTFYGPFLRPDIFINGTLRPLLAPGTTQAGYAGVSGYSVGFCNAVFSRNWNGYIFEILGYLGTDTTVRAAARSYLARKWGIVIP